MHLGNRLDDLEERQRALYLARDHAREATKLDGGFPPEYPLTAWGNALEDIAFILKEKSEENYAAAEQAFLRATQENDRHAKSWTDLGRCRYRWALHLRDKMTPEERKEKLDNALVALKRAEKLGPNKESTEACKWQAYVYWWRGELDLADRSFKEAIRLAEAHDVSSLQSYMLDRADCSLEAARKAIEKFRKAPLAACREMANRVLKEDPKNTRAALLLGESHYLDGENDLAFQAYVHVLREALSKAGSSQLEQMLRCVDLLQQINSEKATVKNLHTAIDLADQVVVAATAAGKSQEARALGQAGTARARLAVVMASTKEDASIRKHREEAISKFEQALERSPSNQDSYIWRTSLADQLWALHQGPDRVKSKSKALDLLKQAKDGAPNVAKFRSGIQQRIDDWNRVK